MAILCDTSIDTNMFICLFAFQLMAKLFGMMSVWLSNTKLEPFFVVQLLFRFIFASLFLLVQIDYAYHLHILAFYFERQTPNPIVNVKTLFLLYSLKSLNFSLSFGHNP